MSFGWPMEADPSRTTWVTFRNTVERLPRASRWLVGLALFLAASALAIALFTFGRYVFLTRLDLNDWESLQLARSFQDELFVLRYAEVFRPWSHLIFRASYLLFGLETRPLATFFFSINVAGAIVVFLILRDCRVQPWMAFIVALAGFFSRANYETANFLACNEPVHGRFWATAIVLALLRARGKKSIVPLLALLGGVGAHEIWVASFPLYLCCVWFRDGWSGLRDLRHQPGMRQFTVVFAALLLLRGLLYLQAPKGFHVLSSQSLGTNVVYFLSTLAHQLLQWPCILITLFGLIALVAAVGRSASSPMALLAPNSPIRLLVFGFAWAVVGYGPHFIAASYRTTYYFCLSSFGAGLIGATFASVTLNKFSGTARLVAAALIPVLFVDPRVAAMTTRVTTAGEMVYPLAASAREAAGDRPARLYFIEDERTFNGRWGSAFSASLSAQTTDNVMLALSFPDQPPHSAFLRPAHLPWLCSRRGEQVLRVTELDRGAGFRLEPLSPCAASDSLPEAFRSNTHLPDAVRREAQRFWEAHGALDDGAAHAAFRALRMLTNDGDGLEGDARLMFEAIVAAAWTEPGRALAYRPNHLPPKDW